MRFPPKVRGSVAAVALVSIALLAGAQSASARSSLSSVQAACAGASEKMLCYHRQVRQRAGLPVLHENRRLNRAALLKQRRIRHCGKVAHEPCGDPFERSFRLAGYLPWGGSWIVGENLAWGFGTPWAAFEGLMHSPTHRANILRRSFRELGVWQGRSPWGPLWVLEYGHRW